MLETLAIFLYGLLHPPLVGCSVKEWKRRTLFIANLKSHGYTVREVPNPLRLYALKGDEEFLLDILDDCISGFPVKWVLGDTQEPVILTDIPSSGRYGVFNRSSIFRDEIEKLGVVVK